MDSYTIFIDVFVFDGHLDVLKDFFEPSHRWQQIEGTRNGIIVAEILQP